MSSVNSYENAARDIEQEKKMVAALKRLSIGNMMNYDPDLPPEELDFQFSYDDVNISSQPQSESDDIGPHETDREVPMSAPAPTSMAPALARAKSLHRQQSRRKSSLISEEVFFDTEEDLVDTPLDPNELLWVPASLHPEVDPEQFKMHIKSTVDEIMEKKLKRGNSMSKRSSLILVEDRNDDDEESNIEEAPSTAPQVPTTPPTSTTSSPSPHHTQQLSGNPKRYSNPSLRDLTKELENLSKLAGMDSSDAVTLARTLSTSSLGYTEVEKQAFDEMNSPPNTKTSPERQESNGGAGTEQFDTPESPTRQRAERRYHRSQRDQTNYAQSQQYPYQEQQHHRSGLDQGQPLQHRRHNRPVNVPTAEHSSKSAAPLKRSRRLDYRKNTGPPGNLSSGSNLQQTKADKLSELRNNLQNSSLTTPSSTSSERTAKPSRSQNVKTNSYSQHQNRSSQMLFSYRNPNLPSGSNQQKVVSRDSPYPSSASTHGPIENQFHSRKVSPVGHQSRPESYQQQVNPDNSRPRQAPPHPRHSNKQHQQNRKSSQESLERAQSPNNSQYPQYGQQMPYNENMRHSKSPAYQPGSSRERHRESKVHRTHSPGNPQQLPSQVHTQQQYQHRHVQPDSQIQKSPLQKVNNKSKELNQNLDLLRSEINEFKESLHKTDPIPMQNVEHTPTTTPDINITQDPDFSFDASYQDVSYEDSLGMEKEVLKELHEEKNGVLGDLNKGDYLETEVDDNVMTSPNLDKVSTKEFEITNNSQGNEQPQEVVPTEVERLHTVYEADTSDKRQGGQQEESITPKTSPRKKKTFGLLGNSENKAHIGGVPSGSAVNAAVTAVAAATASTTDTPTNGKSLKKKKSWTWLKERAVSTSAVESTSNNQQESHSAKKLSPRSISNPETENRDKESVVSDRVSNESARTQESGGSIGKENMISKLFKKKKSTPTSVPAILEEDIPQKESSLQSSGVTVDYESDVESKVSKASSQSKKKSSGGLFKKKSKGKKDKTSIPQSRSNNSINSYISNKSQEPEVHSGGDEFEQIAISQEKEKSYPKKSIIAKLKSGVKSEEREQPIEHIISEVREEEYGHEIDGVDVDMEVEMGTGNTQEVTEVENTPQTTLDVQEKLKKSIKRHSRANQPLEFTDSAFGFPLPPPSQSTLVMLDYRFPVHVERAIYRLSHLKLANPKRSLREQVLLSNFMYAYLNLVDHTLHLEQQLSNTPEVSDATTTENVDDILLDEQMLFSSEEPISAEDEFEGETITIDLDVADVHNMSHLET
ncbi:hypothetical protein CAAN1_03S02454 [[Candida] anglica]|uniref:Protein Zds1 C-terminal domain-containing protein n=1 Tax=[Candida] anglica TaxID=148631 RepID=A0ABP0EL29_9ASCO